MARKIDTKGILLASAVAGLMAAGGLSRMAFADTDASAPADVKCYGVNECKGMGECGGQGHSCAGENACKGKGFLKMSKEECLKLENGRLTPEMEEG